MMYIDNRNVESYSEGEWEKIPTGKIRSSIMPNLIFTVLLMLFYISPYLSRNIHIYVKLFVLVLWIISSVRLPVRKTMYYPKAFVSWWTAYVIWVFAMYIVGHSNEPLPQFFRQLPLYCAPMMMTSIIRSYNLNEMKLFWMAFVGIFAVNLLDNYLIGLIHPELFDMVKAKDGDMTGFISNAGGSDFVGLCLFIIPVFWILFQNTNNKRNKSLAAILVVLSAGYFIFINDRTTAAIVFLMMVILFLLARHAGFGRGHIINFVIGLLVAVLLFGVFFQQIFDFLLGVFEDNLRMANRIEDLNEVMQGTDINDMDDGSLGARYLLWMTSISTFLSSVPNFLIGIGDDVHEGDILSLVNYGVGCHSEFFDVAARYGIVGVLFFYKFISNGVRYLGRIAASEKQRASMIIFLLAWLFFSFVNNSIYVTYMYDILLFFPITLILVNNKKI